MDNTLTQHLLQSLLRTKKAFDAFMAENAHLSLEKQEDCVELLRLAHEKGAAAKATKRRITSAKSHTVNERTKRVPEDWTVVLHTAKTLALCSLPHEPVKERTLVRQATLDDGTVVHVRFSAHNQDIELPHGKDRALITWLMTLAREQNNPRVTFKSALDYIQTFGIPRTGKAYSAFAQAMRRICNVVITYGYVSDTFDQDRDRGEKLVYDKNLPHRSDVKSEFMGLRTLPGLREGYYVEFGEKTFQDLVANPVSVPLDILKRYQDSPIAWDFLQFVSYQAAELDSGQQKAFPLNQVIDFLGSSDTNTRKIRFKIDRLLKELGDYLYNVDLVGRGSQSVLIVKGVPKSAGSQTTPRPSLATNSVLEGEILPPALAEPKARKS